MLLSFFFSLPELGSGPGSRLYLWDLGWKVFFGKITSGHEVGSVSFEGFGASPFSRFALLFCFSLFVRPAPPGELFTIALTRGFHCYFQFEAITRDHGEAEDDEMPIYYRVGNCVLGK